jgi:hypothetical protein
MSQGAMNMTPQIGDRVVEKESGKIYTVSKISKPFNDVRYMVEEWDGFFFANEISVIEENSSECEECKNRAKEFNRAINFALECDGGLDFLRLWREGCFPEIEKEWQDWKDYE